MGTLQYPIYVHTLKNISERPPPLPNTTVDSATSFLSTHTDTMNYMMQYELVFQRLPEKPNERPELSPNGCHSRSISRYFAEVSHSMETVECLSIKQEP